MRCMKHMSLKQKFGTNKFVCIRRFLMSGCMDQAEKIRCCFETDLSYGIEAIAYYMMRARQMMQPVMRIRKIR